MGQADGTDLPFPVPKDCSFVAAPSQTLALTSPKTIRLLSSRKQCFDLQAGCLAQWQQISRTLQTACLLWVSGPD